MSVVSVEFAGNGDTNVQGVLTILLVISPLDRLRRMGVALDEMRREVVVVGGSVTPFHFFSMPTDDFLVGIRGIGKVDPSQNRRRTPAPTPPAEPHYCFITDGILPPCKKHIKKLLAPKLLTFCIYIIATFLHT